MGDRYILSKKCVYCGELNEDIYYAPTSNFYTFDCEKCKKTNFIKSNMTIIKIEDAKLKDVKDGFEKTTMGMLKQEDINAMCKETFKRLKAK